MAVGITSLLLWQRFTSSFGCTGLPSASAASRAMTSLAFMLVLVPEPVWKTSSGNCSGWPPAAMASAADSIAAASSGRSPPRRALTRAQAALTRPSARISAAGWRSPLMAKLRRARSVCAPHRAAAATSISPMLSCSVRGGAVVMGG